LASQIFESCLIQRRSFSLDVRTVRTTRVWPFVPIEPEPSQVVHGVIRRTLLDARAVEVLDSKHHLATLHANRKPAEQEGASVAEVQRSSR
jgi:hypothetical protein